MSAHRAAAVAASLCALSIAPTPTRAQQSTPIDDAPAWRVRVSPALWIPGAEGDLAGGGRKIDVDDLDLTDPEAGFTGDVELTRDDLVIGVSGFWFEADERGSADRALTFDNAVIAPGDAFRAEFSLASAQATLGRRFHWRLTNDNVSQPTAANSVAAHLDLFAGVRVFDAEFSLAGASIPTQRIDGLFVEPIVGVAAGLNVFDRGGLRAGLSAGAQPFGDHTSASLDAHVAFELRPTPNVGAFVGWRQIIVDLESGSDRFETSLAGLFFGVSVRF